MKTGFYSLSNLDKRQLKRFFKDAVSLAYDVHIDKLDCNVSWSRERTTEKTIGEMIDNCSPTYHNVCIDRSVQYEGEGGEVGYTIITDNYFLYIFLTVENLNKLVTKYNLEMK